MSHPIAPHALHGPHAESPRDALRDQAARVLLVTAQQWGLCAQPSQAQPSAARVRQRATFSRGTALGGWCMAV